MSVNYNLAFELQNVIIKFKREFEPKNNCSKLKGAEKFALFLIEELKHQQPVTISEIAKKTKVTLAAVTHQINALEKLGLIKRLSGCTDRRTVCVSLTESGSTQVIELKKEFTKKTRVLADFLGEKDTKDLIHLVKRMSEFREIIKK